MELQTAFYIVGLVFMSFMMIAMISLLAAVLVIKAKINKLHDNITERVDKVKSIGNKISTGFSMISALIRR